MAASDSSHAAECARRELRGRYKAFVAWTERVRPVIVDNNSREREMMGEYRNGTIIAINTGVLQAQFDR
jgi:hypothetical protein